MRLALFVHTSLVVLLTCLATGTPVRADDLYLSAGSDLPGKVYLSEGGTAERLIHTRPARPDRAYPNAIMKVAQTAVGADGKTWFCSGLDGSVMQLLEGRHEIQVFEFSGQIRDLACTGEAQTVYFSVVPTPQNGEPLADGAIYRRDLGEGRPTLVATIRQADVGGNWWGTFTIHEGTIYLATLEETSRIFTVSETGVTQVGEVPTTRIRGLAIAGDGTALCVTGTGEVSALRNFSTPERVLQSARRWTDVSLRSPAENRRPLARP